MLPPPSTPDACAPCTWDHEEPATGIAARLLVAFATATRLPAPLHPLSSARTRRDTKARGLDPGSVEPGPYAARRLLQPTQPASTTAGSPDPRLVCKRTKLTCARALRSPRSPASAQSREGRDPFAASPPRGPIERLGRSLANQPNPCTEHGQRRRSPWPLARGRSPVPPAKAVDGHQPSFHGPGAGGLRCQRCPRKIRLSADRRSCLSTAHDESATPTRSARTPLVVRSWHRRLERPAFARQGSRRSPPATIPPHEPPPPRRVGAHGPPDDLACARPPAAALQHPPCDARGGHRLPCVACADTRGARAASPVLPRRRPRSAAPEVPSLDEPASPLTPSRSRGCW